MNESRGHDSHTPRASRLELQVQKTIDKYGMLEAGGRVLVAVSGGADSVALLHVLRRLALEYNLSLAIAHLNHCLRGSESDGDEEFVRALCCKLEIPFVAERADIRQSALAQKSNLEEAARRTRYEFLRRAASRLGAGKIALGHNKNDQAETVLMRLLRGSGPEGLSSIHPMVEGLFIRPLLECPRSAILQYLQEKSYPYREDSSNIDPAHLRNRVRHSLIPFLEQRFNPRVVDILATQAEQARVAAHFLQTQARQAYESIRNKRPEGVLLPVQEISSFHPALRSLVIREALRETRGSLRSISAAHIRGLLHLCSGRQNGGQVQIPGKCLVIRRYNDLVFLSEKLDDSLDFRYELPLPGACLVRELGLEFTSVVQPRQENEPGRAEKGGSSDFRQLRLLLKQPSFSKDFNSLGEVRICLDVDSLPGSLSVRPRKPGDRYGGPGHRKVKKMLIDAKIDPQTRARLPLIVAGEAVVWLPGFPPASCFRPRPETRNLALIVVRSKPLSNR